MAQAVGCIELQIMQIRYTEIAHHYDPWHRVRRISMMALSPACYIFVVYGFVHLDVRPFVGLTALLP